MLTRYLQSQMLSLFLLLHVVNWTEIQCAAGMNLAHSRTLDETSRRNRQLQQEEVDDSNILNPRRKGTTRTLKDLKKTSKHLKSREDDNQKFEKSKIKGAKSRSSAVVVPSIDKVVEEKDEDDDWPFNSEATIKPLETSLVDGSPRQQATGGCQLNENGLYGTIEGGGDVYEVKYNYQTSVVAGTTITQLGNLVIQELDYAITTALLPNFFDCSGTVRRRQLQEGTVSAISANPIDTFIFSGLTCAKVVPNSDCYVVQGISTVVATGFFNLQEIEDAFKVAVQLALQGNAILSQIDTDIVLDVSALSDSLATLPPIEPTQPAPIQTPVASPGVPAAPIDVVPSPTIQITFAPVPDLLPTRPISQATSPPTVAVGSAPVAAPLSIAPVPVAASPQSPQSTTDSPVATIEVLPVEPDVPRDDNSSNGGLEWWGWLCISIGGGIFVLCCLGMARRSGSANSPSCLPSTSGKSHDRNEKDDDDDRLNRTDPDPEDHTYEPPSSINEAFIPSSLGAFTVAPNEDSEKPTQEPGQSLFGNHPPPAPATAAASSAALEDDDDEVEEMEESFTEEDEEVEEEYDEDEEDEDEDEDAEEENENGEAFEEEEESYFEEEELFENDSHPSQNWGNPPQGYDSRF